MQAEPGRGVMCVIFVHISAGFLCILTQIRCHSPARINAAVRAEGLNYSQFMHGLALANISLNRKALSNMAIEDKQSFAALVEQVKSVLA